MNTAIETAPIKSTVDTNQLSIVKIPLNMLPIKNDKIVNQYIDQYIFVLIYTFLFINIFLPLAPM